MKWTINLWVLSGSYEPREGERETANRIVKDLENRRVLIDPPFRNDIKPCLLSVGEIRKLLNEEIKSLPLDTKLESHLQAMRGSCRHFQSSVQQHGISTESGFYELSPEVSAHFCMALGELRRTFGIHLAVMATQYNLIIHADLASIIPEEEDEEEIK